MRRFALLCGSALAAVSIAVPAPLLAQGSQAQAAGEIPLLSPETMPPQPEPATLPEPEGPDFATSYPEGDRLVFTPAYFIRFSPRSALDMLGQVPGFTVDKADQARGLGQASGNVLLNGQRIASKSDSITDQIARIAAADVVRIELVDGSALNVPGLTGRVANIVARSSSSLKGRFEWEPQLPGENSDLRWQGGNISVTGSSGQLNYTVSASNTPFMGGSIGPNLVGDGASGVETRLSDARNHVHNPKLTATLGYTTTGGAVARFSASYQRNWSRNREDETVIAPVGSPAALEQIRSRGHGYNYELGGDFEFAVGPGRLKLIGLESYRVSDNVTQAVFDPDTGAAPFGSRFELASTSGEHIARAEYSWAMLGGDWQLSSEAAFNRLDRISGLFLLSPAGTFDQIPFPSGTGGVTEDRYETLLTYSRSLVSGVTMQLTLGGEFSQLSQTGANARTRSFRRPKGTLALAWKATPSMDLSFKLERRVGQLEFGDFLAEVNLSDSNTNSGNSELRPQQSWEAELQLVRNFGAWGSLTAKVYDHRITDYVMIVPLSGGGESTGNIDSAREYGLTLDGTLRLDPLGLRGAKFDVKGQFRRSRLTDPVTGDDRPFDFSRPRNVEIDFRHDVAGTDWAWGAGFRNTSFTPYHRLAEVGLDYAIRNNLRLFIEHKDVFGLAVQARWNNMLEGGTVLDRTVYTGPRGSSPVLFTESRRRALGQIFNFTVKGSF